MKYPLLLIGAFILLLVLLSIRDVNAPYNTQWWNTSWHYRVLIQVNTGSSQRVDWPIEQDVNFSAILESFGTGLTFDVNSTRIIEHNSTGQPMHEVVSQFDRGLGFNASTNAIGTMVFMLNGTTSSSTVRTFYVYFDTIQNGAKQFPNYVTELAYNWNGDEFNVNNSIVEWYGDTRRGENTSGLYQVVDFTPIFSGSTGTTAEFTQFSDGIYNLTFNFTTNVTGGPVRVSVAQEGPEVYWNDTNNRTNQGRLVKTYHFYRNNSWIRVSLNYTNVANVTIRRNTTTGGAVAIDLGKYNGNTTNNTRQLNTTDPGSYVWAAERTGLFHVAAINENETGTTNFTAANSTLAGSTNFGRIGVGLNYTTIAPNGSIAVTVVLMFNGTFGDVNPVKSLSSQLISPPVVTFGNAQQWNVTLTASPVKTVYNRGETVVVFGNATLDPFDLVSTMNATFDAGTPGVAGDDQTFRMFDDGTNGDPSANDINFTVPFNLTVNHTVGTWIVSVKAYDNETTFLNVTNTTFIVSNAYNVNLTILSPSVLVSSFVNATFFVANIRNDTNISGANVTCIVGSTPVTNITDLGAGTYLLNFTSPTTVGTYNLNCTAVKFNNTGTQLRPFNTEEPTTSVNISVSPLSTTVTHITLVDTESFDSLVNVTNIGNASASSTNISISLPTNWTSNSTLEFCGSLSLLASCTKMFNVTVSNRTVPGTYTVNFTVSWQNPNTSVSTNRTTLTVIVASNPRLSLQNTEVFGEVGEGLTRTIGNFTVLSIGNANLSNVSYTVSGFSGFNFTFTPTNVLNLTPDSSRSIQVQVSVPPFQTPANYTGTINVSSANDGFRLVSVTVIVPNTTTMAIVASPTLLNATTITQVDTQSFDVMVNTTNTGNTSAFLANISVSFPSNFSANISSASCGNLSVGASCTTTFNVTVAVGTAPGIYRLNFTSMWTQPNQSLGTNSTFVLVNVSSRSLMNVTPSSIAGTVTAGTNGTVGTITVQSLGNANLTNVSFYVIGLSSFTFTFSPGNISSILPGQNQSIQVDASVPGGTAAGNYSGTINVTSATGSMTASVLVSIPANRSWTFTTTSCSRSESPDAGSVCNVTVLNTGNAPINFTVSPSQGNYTFISNTTFNINVSANFTFIVTYNVSGITKAFYNSTFFIFSNNSDAEPLNGSFVVQLIPFITPLLAVNISSAGPIRQLDNFTILVNVTDRSNTGINYTIANITTPNGTVFALILNRTSVSGNLSQWRVVFPYVNASNTSQKVGNTLMRGVYTLFVATEDLTGVNETYIATFNVSANITSVLSSDKSSYAQGQRGEIFYKAIDMNATPLQGAIVTFTLYDAWGNKTCINDCQVQNFTTDDTGTISPQPFFTLSNGDPIGTYNLSAVIVYTDGTTNQTVNSTSRTSFTVTSTSSGGLFVDVETDVVWYPNSVMAFKLLVTDTSGMPVDPDTMNMTVYDPADNVYFSVSLGSMTRESTGLYGYDYAMPVSTAKGVYFAIVNVTKDTFQSMATKAFKVSAGGPYDLRIHLLEQTVPVGDYLDFTVSIENKGEIPIDVLLELWVVQNGQTWYFNSETILTPPQTNTTVTRTAFIFASQPLGLATLNAKVTFDNIQSPVYANTTFEITPPATAPPTRPPAPGGGGGTGTTPGGGPPSSQEYQYDLRIKEYPKEIGLVRGWSDVKAVQVRNNGTGDLHNLSLVLTGIPTPWVKITPPNIELLTPGNVSVFLIDFDIPVSAETQDYPITLTAFSDESRDSRPIKLTVFKSQYELLAAQIEQLKTDLTLLERDTDFAAQVGKDVTKVREMIAEIRTRISDAEQNLAASLYQKATEDIVTARELIDTARRLIGEAPSTVKLEAQVIPLWQILLVIVVLISINAFLFIWVKGMNKRMGAFIKPHLIRSPAPEAPAEFEVMRQEREKLLRMIRLLETEQRDGSISQGAYKELRKRSEEKIKAIDRRLKRKN